MPRRGRIEEMHAVEVEGLAQLGEGVGVVGVKEGMVVHVENQRQAVRLEDAGKVMSAGPGPPADRGPSASRWRGRIWSCGGAGVH